MREGERRDQRKWTRTQEKKKKLKEMTGAGEAVKGNEKKSKDIEYIKSIYRHRLRPIATHSLI